MKKQKRFKKVVEWRKFNFTMMGEPVTDAGALFLLFWFMVPIIGQLMWVFAFVESWYSRKIYWVEIKK